jgi:transposase
MNPKNDTAGHDAGAANWACLASLIETAKLLGIDPQAYLADILAKLVNGHAPRKGEIAGSVASRQSVQARPPSS